METVKTQKVALSEPLQAVLDSLGDTPMLEPKIYKAMQKVPLNMGAILKPVLKEHKLDIDELPPMEVAGFFHQMTSKIRDIQNEDGSYKSTPNTVECNLPNFTECEELQAIFIETASHPSGSDKQLKVYKKLTDKALKISGLDLKTLSPWERELVRQQIITSATQVSMTSMGRELKN